MDFWTFIIILMIIGAFKDVIKKKYQASHSDKTGKAIEQEINDLKQRIYKLENHSSIKRIEKRLKALETIVVDSEYQLNMKFKNAFKEDRDFHDL
jgi:hypothetical protein